MMSRHHEDILTRNRLILVRKLKVTETLLSCLRQDFTLTDEMQQEIEAERTDSKKAGELLDTLVRRGDKAFDRFIYALVESDQHHLADILDPSLAKHYTDERNACRTAQPSLDVRAISNTVPGLKDGQSGHVVMVPGQPPIYVLLPLLPMMTSQMPGEAENSMTQFSTATWANPSGSVLSHPVDEISKSASPQFTKEDIEMIVQEINGVPGRDASAIMRFNVNPAANLELVNSPMIYSMRHIPHGRAVIINNEYFVLKKHVRREGAGHDTANLKELFEQLHFTVIIHENLTAEEIRKCLKEESEHPDHRTSDAFILFLLSHGNEGNIYGIDGDPLSIEVDITSLFDPEHCPALLGKPKIFFIQACQGKSKTRVYSPDSETYEPPEKNQDIDPDLKANLGSELDPVLLEKMKAISLGDKEGYIPGFNKRADMLMSYATVQGYLAWRRSDLGSWFVRCIVSVFSRLAHCDHLVDMLTQANFFLSKLTTAKAEGENSQLAEKTDTFTRKLYFFPSAGSKSI